MTPEMVLDHLRRHLPLFEPFGEPEALAGGYLNYVWRIRGYPEPVIVKHAPPYIASKPDIPLDTGRIDIEARSLAAFEPGGMLAHIGGVLVRPPHLLDYHEPSHMIVMEDVGDCPDLGTWIHQWPRPGCSQADVGRLLGEFTGSFHKLTFGDPQVAKDFDNSSIQRTRLRVQYGAVSEFCRKAGLPDAGKLGERALALGEVLQEPGICLIMGDLWPRSIRITSRGMRVIDWELAHYGRPSQDVGHLTAHLWMVAHCAPTTIAAEKASSILNSFLTAYRSTLAEVYETLFGPEGVRESAVHIGSEILVRTVGRFQDGYLYEGLGPAEPHVQQAIAVAAEHLRSPERSPLLAPLTA